MLNKFITYVFVLLVLSVVAFAAPQEFAIPYIDKAPTIDGVINPGEWDGATSLTGLKVLGTKELAKDPTVLWVAYDDENLYVAYKCFGPVTPVGHDRGRGGAYWEDDTMEVFFAAKADSGGYYQILANCAGGYSDVANNGASIDPIKVSYKANISPAYNSIGAKAEDLYWQGEMAVSWKSMDLKAPKDGQDGLFFFARDHAAGEPYLSTFGDIKNSFNETNNYSRIKYVKDVPAVHMQTGTIMGSKNYIYNPYGTAKDVAIKSTLVFEGNEVGNKKDVVIVPANSGVDTEAKMDFPKGEFTLYTEVSDVAKNITLLKTNATIFNVEPIKFTYDKANKKLIFDLDFTGISLKKRPFVEIRVGKGENFVSGYMLSPDGKKVTDRKVIDLTNIPKGEYTLVYAVVGSFSKTEDIVVE